MREVIIGVPPGIGDIYWILTKLKSFREKEGISKLTLCIAGSAKCKNGTNRRSANIHELTDVVDDSFYGMWDWLNNLNKDCQINVQATKTDTGEKITMDYVLFANGHLENRGDLSTYLPEYETDYDVEILSSNTCLNGIAIYPSSYDINRSWLNKNERFWSDLIHEISKDHLPIIIGAKWDQQLWGLIKPRLRCDYNDLVGKTSLKEVFGVIKNAKYMIGAISGMTIMANHFNAKTTALCPDKFRQGFEFSWLRPGYNYSCIRASELTVDNALSSIRDGLNG